VATLAILDSVDHQVILDIVGSLAPLDIQVTPEVVSAGTRDTVDSRGRVAIQGTADSLVPRDILDTVDSLVLQGTRVTPDTAEAV